MASNDVIANDHMVLMRGRLRETSAHAFKGHQESPISVFKYQKLVEVLNDLRSM